MSLLSFLGDIGMGVLNLEIGNIPGAIISGIGAAHSLSSGSGNAGTTAGSAIGAATTAAGQNRLDQEKMVMDANQQNISGNQAMENELMARAAEEDAQRKTALKQMVLQSDMANPAHSPFDPVAAPKPNSALEATLQNLTSQDSSMLANPSSTQVSTMAPVPTYTALPTNAQQLQKVTGTAPSLLEKVGNIAGPALTLGGIAANGAAAKAGAVPNVPGPVGPMQGPVVGTNAGLFNIPGMTQNPQTGLWQLPQATLGDNFGDQGDDSQD